MKKTIFEAVSELERLDRRAWLGLAGTAVFLLMYEHYATVGFYSRHLKEFFSVDPLYSKVAPHVYWYLSTLFFLGLLPAACWRLATGRHLSELGVRAGVLKDGLAISAVVLSFMSVVVLLAATTATFSHKYPLCKGATSSIGTLVLYETAYFLYFVGWEFFFRGFMLFSLEKVVGGGIAVLIQTIPFALLHVGKPQIEAYSSIFAGIALGMLALRTRSFLYGALIHGLVAVGMDLAALWMSGRL